MTSSTRLPYFCTAQTSNIQQQFFHTLWYLKNISQQVSIFCYFYDIFRKWNNHRYLQKCLPNFACQTSKVSKPHILTCHARMKTCNYTSRKESYGAGYPGPDPLPRLRGGPRAPRRARGRAPAAPRRRGGRGRRLPPRRLPVHLRGRAGRQRGGGRARLS